MSLAEVVVIVGVLSLLALTLLLALPRQRETSRVASCRMNLRQIGVALVLYDQQAGHLPTVPVLGPDPAVSRPGPLKAMLDAFGLHDLEPLTATDKPPAPHPGFDVAEHRVRGFLCVSDSNAMTVAFPGPVSYRATAGDTPDGHDGAFSPGRRIDLKSVEAADGTGYTAGFSERLVGDALAAPALHNYALVPGPLGGAGCPSPGATAWRGDAGASWALADWKWTLYNHALVPDAAPSCLAEDRRTAVFGASSRHPAGVNVLLLDGGVKTYTPGVDPNIWRALATVGTPARGDGPTAP